MPFKLFIVYDESRKIIVPECSGFAVTAGNHILNVSRRLYQLNMNFENEFILYEVATCPDNPTLLLHDEPILHSWDEWRTPETQSNTEVNTSDLK